MRIAINLIITLNLVLSASLSRADVVYLKDGSAEKGIVVEEYADRIVLSTEYGETEMPRAEIREVIFDLPEQNLIALGNRSRDMGDYRRAYFYYYRAMKINPSFKEAQDGLNYLEGYLFRMETVRKNEEIELRQTVEEGKAEVERLENEKALDDLKRVIGISIEDSGKDIKVAEVYENMPAYEAGVRKGDILSSVWNRLTGYMSSDEVARLLTKPGNMEILAAIDRDIALKRGAIRPFELMLELDGLHVSKISDKSGAQAAGLEPGDLILSVDGAMIRYTPQNEVMSFLDLDDKVIRIRRKVTIWRSK